MGIARQVPNNLSDYTITLAGFWTREKRRECPNLKRRGTLQGGKCRAEARHYDD